MQLLIADAGLRPSVSLIFRNVNDSRERQDAMLEEALTKANNLRRDGKEFLFLVLHHRAVYEALATKLAGGLTHAVATTIYFGGETVGAEPDILTDLDTVITFDLDRAKKALYPAADPINSRSQTLQQEQTAEAHRKIAAEARRLLLRHQDLQLIIEGKSLDALPDDDDRRIVRRARRLDRFLTQPFHWTEPWTNLPGIHVPLNETLEGCGAILRGDCDDLPEDAFYFVGNLSAVREKATCN